MKGDFCDGTGFDDQGTYKKSKNDVSFDYAILTFFLMSKTRFSFIMENFLTPTQSRRHLRIAQSGEFNFCVSFFCNFFLIKIIIVLRALFDFFFLSQKFTFNVFFFCISLRNISFF